MQKIQKVESVNIHSDCKATCKKRTDSSGVFTCSGKVCKRWRASIIDYKTTSEKSADKKKIHLCLKVFKFQDNKFKIVQKNL